MLLSAKDLEGMLRRHYIPDDKPHAGLFAAEIQSPCGTRRADALFMPLTTSDHSPLIGHEIKVTRSDLLVELNDPTKADPWAQYCTAWYLVVSDPVIAKGLENLIPSHWGIMAPPSGRRTRSMTVIRTAAKLNPTHQAPAFRRLMVWKIWEDINKRDNQATALRIANSELERARAQIVELGVKANARDPESLPIVKKVIEITELVKELSGRHYYRDDDPRVIAQAIVDYREVTDEARRIVEAARWQAQSARSLAERSKDLCQAVDEIAKRAEKAIETEQRIKKGPLTKQRIRKA